MSNDNLKKRSGARRSVTVAIRNLQQLIDDNRPSQEIRIAMEMLGKKGDRLEEVTVTCLQEVDESDYDQAYDEAESYRDSIDQIQSAARIHLESLATQTSITLLLCQKYLCPGLGEIIYSGGNSGRSSKLR